MNVLALSLGLRVQPTYSLFFDIRLSEFPSGNPPPCLLLLLLLLLLTKPTLRPKTISAATALKSPRNT